MLIENEDGVAGYFDTYMKVAFIATNAVNKSTEITNGRFTNIKFMNQAEIDKSENEAFEGTL